MIEVGSMGKTELPKVVIKLKSLARLLCDAAEMGRAVEDKILNAAFIEVPRGIDIVTPSESILRKLGYLKRNHQYRAGLNLAKMKEGFKYIREGIVEVSLLPGTRQIGRRYRIVVSP